MALRLLVSSIILFISLPFIESFSQENFYDNIIKLDGYIYEVSLKKKGLYYFCFFSKDLKKDIKFKIKSNNIFFEDTTLTLLHWGTVQPEIIMNNLNYHIEIIEWSNSIPNRKNFLKKRILSNWNSIRYGKVHLEAINYKIVENVIGRKIKDIDWVLYGQPLYPENLGSNNPYLIVLRFFKIE